MTDTKKTPFRSRAADALTELRTIISEVDTKCSSKSQVIPEFLNGDNRVVHFQCTVENTYRDIDSQLQALLKLDALMEHISNNEDRWILPYGKTTTRRWHTHSFPQAGDNPPQRTAQLEIIDNDILQSSLSSHGGKGGLTFRLPVVEVQPEGKARVGLLVGRLVDSSFKVR